MPIVSTDIKFRLSGGAANTNPNASLGGAKSSTDAPSSIFDDVTSAEAAAGDTEYRCIYVHNNHATLTMLGAKVWVQDNTPSPDTTVALGAGSSAIGGTEPTVANEDTAPAGVTFSTPTDLASGIALGDIPAGQSKAAWIRRATSPGAAMAADSFKLRVACDTQP